MRQKFIFSILNILMLSVVIATVSIFFIENTNWIGVVLIILAILCIFSLVPFKISLKSIQPDIIFGMIDNEILAVMAIFGAHIAGVAGAITGGVVGMWFVIDNFIEHFSFGNFSTLCITNLRHS